MFQTYHALKFIGVGLVFIILGVFLLTTPMVRDDPNQLSTRDLLVGVGPVLAGVLCIGLGVFSFMRKK
jgi:hypothetical protein